MRAAQIAKRFERAIKRRGILGALAVAPRAGWASLRPILAGSSRRGQKQLEMEQQWDLEHGVETEGVVHPANLDACTENWVHGVQYQPSAPVEFRRVISSVSLEFERFIFVDVGSGKGRGLVLAAQYPFCKIIGVEFSRGLHAVAQRNVIRAGLNGRIELVCADILDWPLPLIRGSHIEGDAPVEKSALCRGVAGKREDEVADVLGLALYLYNPFDMVVMREFVAKVERSLGENWRPMWVFYSNPKEARAWDECSWFRRAAEGRDGDGYVVWQSVGQEKK